MDESVLAGEDFDECAEFLDGDDATFVDLANLDFGAHAFDFAPGDFHALGRYRENLYRPIIFNVDFATGLIDEPLNILAAGANQHPDLFRIDLQSNNARRIFRNLGARSGQDGGHVPQNLEAGSISLLNGLSHNRQRQSLKLEVQLEAGDPLLRTGDLAIHIAERIFPSNNIGEELIAADLIIGPVLRANAD